MTGRFGDFTAVDRVSARVQAGEVVVKGAFSSCAKALDAFVDRMSTALVTKAPVLRAVAPTECSVGRRRRCSVWVCDQRA